MPSDLVDSLSTRDTLPVSSTRLAVESDPGFVAPRQLDPDVSVKPSMHIYSLKDSKTFQ